MAGNGGREVPGNLGDRLRAATVAHRDAQEVATKRAKAWRRLVVEAVDSGMSQGDVAELAGGISRARVHAIVVTECSRG